MCSWFLTLAWYSKGVLWALRKAAWCLCMENLFSYWSFKHSGNSHFLVCWIPWMSLALLCWYVEAQTHFFLIPWFLNVGPKKWHIHRQDSWFVLLGLCGVQAGPPSWIWNPAQVMREWPGYLEWVSKEKDVLKEFSVSVKVLWGPTGVPFSSNPCHPAISCIHPSCGLRVCTEVPGWGPSHGPGRVPPGQGERTCHHLHRWDWCHCNQEIRCPDRGWVMPKQSLGSFF